MRTGETEHAHLGLADAGEDAVLVATAARCPILLGRPPTGLLEIP